MYLTIYWSYTVYGRAKPWPCSPSDNLSPTESEPGINGTGEKREERAKSACRGWVPVRPTVIRENLMGEVKLHHPLKDK